MRRRASLVLLALAFFLATLSPLLRWYAFPRVVAVPQNQYQETVLEAENAELLDYSSLKPRIEPKVTIIQTLKGNVEAAKKVKEETGRDVVVWDALSYAHDSKGQTVTSIPERYIFDGHTQEPVHASGESVDGDAVRRTGLTYKWPFLTKKRDYEYYDPMTRASAPILFKGVRDHRGMEVYYFEQTIPWQKVVLPKTLPLGMKPADVEKLGLERWYTTKRMFWVEPVTGAPVRGEEIHKEEMRWPKASGMPPLPAFSAHVKIRDDYIDHITDLVKANRQRVLMFHTYIPIGLLALAAALLAASLWLESRSRRAPDEAPSPQPTPSPPEPVTA
ncbi:DUF3068 domain-containing protein [Streptomyces sp. NPDC051940]|uniref:DUF3068 domain-containing protein n=1 Tax=Streptomyces sp. NPDC051940 TaxID=3155675 RepID=UPI00341791A2